MSIFVFALFLMISASKFSNNEHYIDTFDILWIQFFRKYQRSVAE